MDHILLSVGNICPW